jgi:hypothetical protein
MVGEKVIAKGFPVPAEIKFPAGKKVYGSVNRVH